MKNGKKLKIGMILIAFIHLMGTGSFWAFISAFALNVKGLSSSLVGVMIAVYSVAMMFGCLFWTMICDRLKTNRKIYILGMFLSLGLTLAVYFAPNARSLILFYGLHGFVNGPMQNVMEAWILKLSGDDTGKYGRIRSFGALSYGLFAFIVGMWIRKSGYGPMLYMTMTALILGILVAFFLPDPEYRRSEKGASFRLSEVGEILKNPAMLVMIFIALFLGLANAPAGNMKILMVEALGGDTGTQGLDSVIGSFLQFVMFFMTPLIMKNKAKHVLFACTLLVTAGSGIMTGAQSIPVFLAGSLLLYINYAALQTSMMRVVCENVDPAYQNTGIGITSVVYNSVSSIIGMLVSGRIADLCGIRTVLLLMTLMAFIALVIAAVQLKMKQTKK